MSYLKLFVVVLSIVPIYSFAYNILVLLPLPAISHFNTFKTLFKGLAQTGHNVTVMSDFPVDDPIPNYRNVEFGIDNEVFNSTLVQSFTDQKHIEADSRLQRYMFPFVLAEFGQLVCKKGFRSKSFHNFLKENHTFDIVIVEHFNSDCFLAVAKKFNAPIIRVHTCNMVPWTGYRYGFPDNPAYISNIFLQYTHKLSFIERVENTLHTLIYSIYFNYFVVNEDQRVYMKYFGDIGATLHSDILNDSLLLVASHYTLNFPRPLVPNVVEIGGLHIGKSKPVPKDIEKWINESKHGVVYFSFGSLVKGYTMPAEKRQAFINAFKRLPQRVIWKWENDTMEGKTDNIMIGKWMPQFDILSHPNVKAFISHGGLLGTFEAVHCGVPILVMPQFGDQHTNAKAIESVGGGEILYLSDATEEKIYNALTKILSPNFQQQAKELSERFRDRPMPPLETAIYWVEYVARHKGAHFMKTAAVGMPFYQYYLLDVIAFILAVLIVFFYVSYLVLRALLRLVFKPKSTKIKKS